MKVETKTVIVLSEKEREILEKAYNLAVELISISDKTVVYDVACQTADRLEELLACTEIETMG